MITKKRLVETLENLAIVVRLSIPTVKSSSKRENLWDAVFNAEAIVSMAKASESGVKK